MLPRPDGLSSEAILLTLPQSSWDSWSHHHAWLKQRLWSTRIGTTTQGGQVICLDFPVCWPPWLATESQHFGRIQPWDRVAGSSAWGEAYRFRDIPKALRLGSDQEHTVQTVRRHRGPRSHPCLVRRLVVRRSIPSHRLPPRTRRSPGGNLTSGRQALDCEPCRELHCSGAIDPDPGSQFPNEHFHPCPPTHGRPADFRRMAVLPVRGFEVPQVHATAPSAGSRPPAGPPHPSTTGVRPGLCFRDDMDVTVTQVRSPGDRFLTGLGGPTSNTPVRLPAGLDWNSGLKHLSAPLGTTLEEGSRNTGDYHFVRRTVRGSPQTSGPRFLHRRLMGLPTIARGVLRRAGHGPSFQKIWRSQDFSQLSQPFDP